MQERKKSSTHKKSNANSKKPVAIQISGVDIPFFEAYRPHFSRRPSEIAGFLRKKTNQFKEKQNYGHLNGLESIENNRITPGTFYLRDEQLEIIALDKGLDALDYNLVTWMWGLPAPEAILKPRRHAVTALHVYPKRGISLSLDEKENVRHVEIFRPMSLAEYRKRYHQLESVPA